MTDKKTPEKEGFVEVKGGRVWYKIVGEGGKKTPLIVLHGGPAYPHDYLEPLEDLSTNREVIFYDQLGCGNSDRPKDTSLWTVERYVEELHQLIKILKLKNYNLLGQSWGSALAASFALTSPKGLQSIIFADPYLSTPIWEQDANRLIESLPTEHQEILEKHYDTATLKSKKFKKASDEYYKRFVFRLDPIPAPIIRSDNKMNRTIYNHMWGPKEFAATGTLKKLDLSGRLHEITVPTLIICGRFDEATPEAGELFKNLLPDARLTIMENSAHMAHWNDRETYMKTVQEFLNSVE